MTCHCIRPDGNCFLCRGGGSPIYFLTYPPKIAGYIPNYQAQDNGWICPRCGSVYGPSVGYGVQGIYLGIGITYRLFEFGI